MQCQVNPNSNSDLELIMCKSLMVTSYYKHMFHVKTSSQLQNFKNPKTPSPKVPAKSEGIFNLRAEWQLSCLLPGEESASSQQECQRRNGPYTGFHGFREH